MISRPTSAALFVWYFRQMPASGVYVLRTRVARGAAGVVVVVVDEGSCDSGFG